MRATDPPASTPPASNRGAPSITVAAVGALPRASMPSPARPPIAPPPAPPRVPARAPAVDPTDLPSPPAPPTSPASRPPGPADERPPSSVVDLRASSRGSARPPRSARVVLASLLVLRGWPDPLLDRVGHDPRADYVERFWLPILGPSALLLLRRLVNALESGDGAGGAGGVTSGEAAEAPRTIAVGDLAASLGMGSPRGPSGAFYRTLERLVSFGFAHLVDDATLAVRTHLPPLTRRQLKRLPDTVRDEHERWLVHQEQAPGLATEHMTRRARALALSLLELGEDRVGAERQLHRWQFHPAIAHEAIRWAAAEHERRRPPPPVPA